MPGFAVSGKELKELLKVAAKGPMPFAFYAAASVEDCLLAMHKTRGVKILKDSLRDEGASADKLAFGTLAVEGKALVLRCDKEPAGLQKKLQKWLTSQKVMRPVVIAADAGAAPQPAADGSQPAMRERSADAPSGQGSPRARQIAKKAEQMSRFIDSLKDRPIRNAMQQRVVYLRSSLERDREDEALSTLKSLVAARKKLEHSENIYGQPVMPKVQERREPQPPEAPHQNVAPPAAGQTPYGVKTGMASPPQSPNPNAAPPVEAPGDNNQGSKYAYKPVEIPQPSQPKPAPAREQKADKQLKVLESRFRVAYQTTLRAHEKTSPVGKAVKQLAGMFVKEMRKEIPDFKRLEVFITQANRLSAKAPAEEAEAANQPKDLDSRLKRARKRLNKSMGLVESELLKLSQQIEAECQGLPGVNRINKAMQKVFDRFAKIGAQITDRVDEAMSAGQDKSAKAKATAKLARKLNAAMKNDKKLAGLATNPFLPCKAYGVMLHALSTIDTDLQAS
ncbi:MAG: hypothetical protein AAFQ21_15490 [Pseudomonadota bacterium]